jgi:hypothetical protein
MLGQSSEKGQEARVGRVAGLKRHRYSKLSKQGRLDGQRRYLPLAWVKSVLGTTRPPGPDGGCRAGKLAGQG